jgi:hypothetical protein
MKYIITYYVAGNKYTEEYTIAEMLEYLPKRFKSESDDVIYKLFKSLFD